MIVPEVGLELRPNRESPQRALCLDGHKPANNSMPQCPWSRWQNLVINVVALAGFGTV